MSCRTGHRRLCSCGMLWTPRSKTPKSYAGSLARKGSVSSARLMRIAFNSKQNVFWRRRSTPAETDNHSSPPYSGLFFGPPAWLRFVGSRKQLRSRLRAWKSDTVESHHRRPRSGLDSSLKRTSPPVGTGSFSFDLLEAVEPAVRGRETGRPDARAGQAQKRLRLQVNARVGGVAAPCTCPTEPV